jgi:CheY-like chemotaxis protein
MRAEHELAQRGRADADTRAPPKRSGVYESAPKADLGPAAAPSLPERARGGGPCVLLVSQNDNAIRGLSRVLATYDSEVLSARTAGEAIYQLESTCVARFRVRLALIDMLLPGLRGHELIDVLRRTPHAADARFILLSSLSPVTAERVRIEFGADGVLPLNWGMLRAEEAISDWLGYRDSRPL